VGTLYTCQDKTKYSSPKKKKASWLVLGTKDLEKNKVLYFTDSFCSFSLFFYLLFPRFLFPFPFYSLPFPSSLCKTKHKSGVVRIGMLCCQRNIKIKKLPRTKNGGWGREGCVLPILRIQMGRQLVTPKQWISQNVRVYKKLLNLPNMKLCAYSLCDIFQQPPENSMQLQWTYTVELRTRTVELVSGG
jgi:hypothetical protein